jgi:superfamily II DNA or RNA helicase
VARLELSEDEAALREAIGSSALIRARAQLDQGELADVRWERRIGQAHGRVRGAGWAVATVTRDTDGAIAAVEGSCSCSQRTSCGHPAALILAAFPGIDVPRPRKATIDKTKTRSAEWEAALSTLVRDVAAPTARSEPDQAQLGLQFELTNAASRPGTAPSWRIAMRPVVPGRTGWIRTGISWSSLSYARVGRAGGTERHRQLLSEIATLSTTGGDPYYYGGYQQSIFLDGFKSRRIWDLLAEADEIGLPLVQAGKPAGPVVVGRRAARLSVRVERVGDDLAVAPTLLADGALVSPECSILVGQPAHGIAWWGLGDESEPHSKDRVLRLAPLARTMSKGMARALTGSAILIPAADEKRFFEQFYPDLLRQVDVVAAGESVRLPDVGPAMLALTVTPAAGQRLSLSWEWTRFVGDHRHSEPLWSPVAAAQADHREDVVRRVTEVIAKPVPDLLEPSPLGPRLAAAATVAGDAMIRFLGEVVPRLSELDGVEVIAPAGPDYRETYEAPVITFAGADSVGQQDWFDLSVRVSVGGEQVVFDELFVALALDQQYLILPSGTYFSLDHAEFRQLRELIAESRALDDAPAGVLRVGRFQAGLWDELAELGEVTGQAAGWQRSVRALTDIGAAADHPLPQGLAATLRPYQREGFQWLATLHDHELGGILADDMGLGKTLQTLALICHARGHSRSPAPFLVVAPASVIYNWVSEAERFTPGLKVRAVTQTLARRGVDLAEAAAGTDIVVTSYTLFRLEYDDYQALNWAGLVLDEAQFVKNPQSQGYRCAKRLPVPFKLAITGTPMENNLTELWSLCSITAPGLFPRPDRFAEYYRNPIEKGRDAERLAQLRRRIRPLMLRRRKADVAVDLPEKQEQVVPLELDRKHRKLYQTYLQRERQKVLGLLGDLEKNRFEVFRSLTLLRQASLDVALIDPKHHDVPSTKLDALTEQVANLVAEGHRSLVFSQFTRFLGSARERLERAGIECCYLDGKTRDRAAVLAEFKNGTAPVFLISLKAGGFGLNLTEADYCILLDPWWNPATEAQAVDRIHRIGQARNVMVYRLVAKDTIEEKVMALKERKAELFSSVLDGGEFASAQFTAADIRALLE